MYALIKQITRNEFQTCCFVSFIPVCIKLDFAQIFEIDMVLKLVNGLPFKATKYAISISFLTPTPYCPSSAFPRQCHCLQVLCVWHVSGVTISQMQHPVCVWPLQSLYHGILIMMDFWEVFCPFGNCKICKSLFCSVIATNHSPTIFRMLKLFDSFMSRWAAELKISEADLDDGALSGALARVIGKLPCKALSGNDELTLNHQLRLSMRTKYFLWALLSGSPTVTNEIPSESLINKELESQNPGTFWSTNFQGFLTFQVDYFEI